MASLIFRSLAKPNTRLKLPAILCAACFIRRNEFRVEFYIILHCNHPCPPTRDILIETWQNSCVAVKIQNSIILAENRNLFYPFFTSEFSYTSYVTIPSTLTPTRTTLPIKKGAMKNSQKIPNCHHHQQLSPKIGIKKRFAASPFVCITIPSCIPFSTRG